MNKKKLITYSVIFVVVVTGIILALTIGNNGKDVTSSGYTYLRYKDGTYIGMEKTESGNIKTEVLILGETIKDIKIVEFPDRFLEENNALRDEIPELLFEVIQTQKIVIPKASDNSAYVLNKILKAIRHALDQSLI